MAEALIVVDEIEACMSCDATFTQEELHAFDPEDNDHCPGCGARGTMTTYYGDPAHRIMGYALDIPDSEARAKAMLAEAYRRGAEAMRERAVAALDRGVRSWPANSEGRGAAVAARETVRALPLDDDAREDAQGGEG